MGKNTFPICDPGNDRGYGGNGIDYIDDGYEMMCFMEITTMTHSGGHGSDILSGGNGNDRLEDAAGTTTFVGGRGADTFVISNNQRNSKVRDLRDVGDKVIFQNISDPSARFDGSDFVMMSDGEVVCTVENLLDRIHAREARFVGGGDVGFEITKSAYEKLLR